MPARLEHPSRERRDAVAATAGRPRDAGRRAQSNAAWDRLATYNEPRHFTEPDYQPGPGAGTNPSPKSAPTGTPPLLDRIDVSCLVP